MTTLIATSVIRGSRQGESHGGVYLVDLDRQRVRQAVDWDKTDIDWQGHGGDRGLRGIAFDKDRVFIAASDELLLYTPDFGLIASYRSPYLKHCHEICRYERRLYLTSTGFDSILGFDLDQNQFSLGLHLRNRDGRVSAVPYDPGETRGPPPGNELHLNTIYCDSRGMFISGANTEAILAYSGRSIDRFAALPPAVNNARPLRGGIVFNDSPANVVRFVAQGKQRVFAVPRYGDDELTHTDLEDPGIARQAFGRGLCTVSETVIAAGSSPLTITLHDLETMKSLVSINLAMDVRAAVQGLEVWPYPV